MLSFFFGVISLYVWFKQMLLQNYNNGKPYFSHEMLNILGKCISAQPSVDCMYFYLQYAWLGHIKFITVCMLGLCVCALVASYSGIHAVELKTFTSAGTDCISLV